MPEKPAFTLGCHNNQLTSLVCEGEGVDVGKGMWSTGLRWSTGICFQTGDQLLLLLLLFCCYVQCEFYTQMFYKTSVFVFSMSTHNY